MLSKALKDLIKTTNNGAVVYIHNMARFDIVFLMRVINNLNIPFLKVVPLVRNHLTMAIRIT
jgi:hypothetical protein